MLSTLRDLWQTLTLDEEDVHRVAADVSAEMLAEITANTPPAFLQPVAATPSPETGASRSLEEDPPVRLDLASGTHFLSASDRAREGASLTRMGEQSYLAFQTPPRGDVGKVAMGEAFYHRLLTALEERGMSIQAAASAAPQLLDPALAHENLTKGLAGMYGPPRTTSSATLKVGEPSAAPEPEKREPEKSLVQFEDRFAGRLDERLHQPTGKWEHDGMQGPAYGSSRPL